MKLFFSELHEVYEFGSGFNKPVVLALVLVYNTIDYKRFRIIYHANPMWRIDEDSEATNEQHHHLVLAIFKAESIKKNQSD